MKRKCGVGRCKPTKKANVEGADKGTENLMASNAGDESTWSDAAKDPLDTLMEVAIAQAKSTTSRGRSAGLKNDKSNEKTSRGNSLAKSTTSRGRSAGLNNDKSNEKTSSGNSLRGNNVLKDVATFAAKVSRAVGSSTSDPRTESRPLQDEMTNAGEQTSSRHDPFDNTTKEINAALSVIKTVMKTDAAKPFNSPVDPVALDIPDYFDIIETPMDFDTICNNIDLGFKYKNSEDIYRDVELIWDNCSKYNKNGTKIIELMKQAKTKFLKLWAAAGLYIQRQEPSNVHSGKSLLHAAEDSVRHDYRGHAHLDGSMIRNSIHQGKPWLMGEDIHPPHPSCFSYAYRPPHISSQCSCSWCFRGSQSSMYHNTWHSSPGGSGIANHYNQRHFETSSQHERPHHLQYHDRWWQHQPSYDQHQASLQQAVMNSQNPGSSNVYSNQQKQWQMYSSHTVGYHPGLTHADDLHHHSNIPRFPYHQPGVPSTYSAGHPHLNSPLEATPRHTKRVQEDMTALDPDGPSLQKHQRVDATQVNSFPRKHSPARHEENIGSARKHSPARHEENIGSAGHPHLNSPMGDIPRHTKRVQEDLTALDTDGPSLQKHQQVVGTQVNPSSRKHSPVRHEENSGSSGHPHLNSPMEDIPRHTKRVQEDLTALDTDGPSLQKHQQVVGNQVNPSSRKHSPVRHEEKSGSSGHVHVTTARESSVRPPTCRPESSVVPDANNCSSEEYQIDQNEPDSPLSDDCAMPVPEEDANLSQPGSSTPEASPVANEHATVESDSAALEKKSRGRGPTRCLKLLFQGKRISITTNDLGQPVGVDARKLTSFLGTIARDGHKAPLNYIEWRAMPEVHKENMWKEVQEKFIIDPKSKYWVLKSISIKWRDWKKRLKSDRYLTCTTNEERLANLDERVLPDQWEYLVSYWNSEKGERHSAINKASGAKLVLRHVAGSKSYARLREEEKEKRPDKKPPSRAELFMLTRMRKDGKPVNEASSAIIEKLRQTQDTSETSTVQDEAFVELVGRSKKGHVRCVELGSSPSDFMTLRKHSQVVSTQLAVEAKAEVLDIKNKMGTMEETCAQMATQMASMMSMMSSLQKNISNGIVPGPDASNDQGSQDNSWNRPPILKAYSRRHYSRKRENMGTSSTPGSSVKPNSTPDLGTPHLPRASGSSTFYRTRPDQAHDTSGPCEKIPPRQINPTPPTTGLSRRKKRV